LKRGTKLDVAKARYHALMRLYHPDHAALRFHYPEALAVAARKSAAVNEAYAALRCA
jgi:DnaJ-domain-containing protein 1